MGSTIIADEMGWFTKQFTDASARLAELQPAQPYYLHCKGGVRSLKGMDALKAAGFQSVESVRGGILAYAAEVDAQVGPG